MLRVLLILVALIALLAGAFGIFAWNASRGVTLDTVETQYLEPSDRYLDVVGMTVRIREEGPADAPVVLMLHGFTFSLESYDALAADLSADYRVIRYDLRGHGLTGPDPQKRYAPEQRAAHIGEVLDALEISEAHIVGNSLGGLAAWRFAAAAPERVASLVLISPGAYPINGVGEEPAPVPPALEAYLRMVPEAGLDLSLTRIYADPESVSEERRAELRAMMRREGNGQAFIDALNVFTLPDPEPVLAQVTTPTLIIWGEEDQVIAPSDGERLASVMPDAELVTLAGVGHVAHEEAPSRVASDIRRFFAGLSE